MYLLSSLRENIGTMTTNDGLRLLDPGLYADAGPPHELFSELRRNAPVARWQIPGLEPFWSIVKHGDITSISKQPDKFLSAPGITLAPGERVAAEVPGFSAMRVVITMDPPEHRVVRKVASPWFTSRALESIDAAVEESAVQHADALARNPEGRPDLATEIAIKHPLRIL